MELLILMSALLLAGALAVVKAFQYVPSSASEFELSRRAGDGDGVAAYELIRRPLLPTLVGLKVLKIVVLTSVLAALLLLTHDILIGLVLLVVFWLASELIVAKGWSIKMAMAAQRAVEPKIIHLVKYVSGIFRHFATHDTVHAQIAVSSREELLHIINSDTTLLSSDEKTRIQGAIAYGQLKIADVMVPADKIATVDIKETVGPVLLTRLHKDGHQVFVAVKKDLNDVRGLLYMSDATSGHPEIRTVKDAVRSRVHYVGQDEPLQSVLAAGLQSGRQLFIVVDNQGNTSGLITLADALAKLLGSAPPTETRLSTDPTKV